MSQNANTTARTVAASADKRGSLDIAALVLLAILLAAGFVLNFTLGNALAISGIKPQFIIAAYCLAVLLVRPGVPQAVVIGLVSAAVIQPTTSILGLNFLTEAAGAASMALVVRAAGTGKAVPFAGALFTTFVSGALFAVCGTVLMQADMATVLVKLPTVLGTAAFNAAVVQALFLPLSKIVRR